jgi:hypothetical protein
MKRLLSLLCLAAAAQAAPTASAPATLSKEGDLTTILLKPEAEQRLRLVTVPVTRRAVPAVRLFSGEVVQSLATRDGQLAPMLGGTLEEALRTADLQIAADGRVAQAQVQVDAAKVTLARAETIHRAEAGSERAVDEARAAHALAEAAWRTARAQRELLGSSPNPAPGASRAWVRVAVYSGEASLLDATAPAQVRPLTSSGPGRPAAPIAGPRTANAATATLDWYYELPAGHATRPGERVAVEIPRRDRQTEHLVVPFNAVLYDIHGGQWVYEAIATHTYVRRRVQVARLAGADAVLATGPAPGAKIVTDGSAELFGTEFMTGK